MLIKLNCGEAVAYHSTLLFGLKKPKTVWKEFRPNKLI